MLSGDIENYLKKLERELDYLSRLVSQQSRRIDYLEGRLDRVPWGYREDILRKRRNP